MIALFAALHFYLVADVNHNEPSCVRSQEYVHVKARTDGNFTLIITQAPLQKCKAASELTREKAQQVLDGWTAQDGSPRLDLGAHLEGDKLKPILAEQIRLERVRRGFFLPKEREQLKTQAGLVKAYPLTTKKLSPIMLEDLHQQVMRAVKR